MKGSVPAEVAYTKIEDALRVINSAPASPSVNLIERALLIAKARMKHLEQRLSETETLRDRFALQLLPSILSSQNLSALPTVTIEDRICLAYYQADKVLEIRAQGSAEAPGETTSPDFPKFAVGDLVTLSSVPGINFTVLEVLDKNPDGLQVYRLNRKPLDQETEDNMTLVLARA